MSPLYAIQYKRKKAVSLIFAVTVLALLSVVAITWVRLTELELKASQYYTDKVKVRMISRAGVDYAITQLQKMLSDNTINDATAAWRYGDSADTPLVNAVNPSFKAGVIAGKGYSGIVGRGSYVANGDIFSLKVIDTSQGIYVNGGIFDGQTSATYGSIVAKIINNMAYALNANGKGPHLTGNEGTLIINNRPSGGYENLSELKSILGDNKYKEIKDYLTVRAWTDPNTFRAFKFDDEDADTYNDNIQSVVVEPRAPVNINTAPVEVLTAVMADIGASYVEDHHHALYPNVPSNPNTNPADGACVTISMNEAASLANDIVSHRSSTPFTTWYQFYHFVHDHKNAFSGNDELKHLKVDVVFANCNPNTDIKFGNPNASWASLGFKIGGDERFRGADKFDLYDTNGIPTYTTEFCFHSSGTYEIHSLGRIWTQDNTEAAQEYIYTVVEVFNRVVLSSQADFEGSDSYITPGFTQVPHRNDVKITGTAVKTNTETYPEFDPSSTDVVILQNDPRVASSYNFQRSAAIYDGQVMLKTCTGAHDLSSAILYFPFDPDGNNSGNSSNPNDISPAKGTMSSEVKERSIIEAESESRPLGTRLSGESVTIPHFEMNTNLLPDGVHFTTRRHIRSFVTNTSIGNRASILVWVKPTYTTNDNKVEDLIKGLHSSGDPLYGGGFNANGYATSTPTLFVDWTMDGYILSCWRNYKNPNQNRVQFIVQSDSGYIWHSVTSNTSLQRGHWYQLGLVFNSNQTKMYVNGEEFLGTAGGPFGASTIHCADWGIYNSSDKPAMAHATEDEIQIYNTELPATDVADYYNLGRYHDSGTYVSPSISTNEAVVWHSITWNSFLPSSTSLSVDADVNPGAGYSNDTSSFTDPSATNTIGIAGNSIKFRVSLSSSESVVLDTPVLDDVTIVYYRLSPKIFIWQEDYQGS